MKYTINTIQERKTSTGKVLADLNVTDETGAVYDKVVIWASAWEGFKDIMMGHTIEGELKIEQNGQYTNKTLFPPYKAKSGTTGGNKTGAMTAVMEKKNANISEAMERKDEAIKNSSCFRDATTLTIESSRLASLNGAVMNDELLKAEWVKWNKWLKDNYDGEPFKG